MSKSYFFQSTSDENVFQGMTIPWFLWDVLQMSKSIIDENVFKGIYQTITIECFIHLKRIQLWCKCQNQPLMTIFSKGCRSVAIHMKKGDTLQASYLHSLSLRIIVTLPQLVIKYSWQQFLKVHFFQLMARKDGKEMHMGTLWQVCKMDHLIVSCFMFFMAD